MKRLIIITTLILITATSSAQKGISLGFRGGVNFSTIRTAETVDENKVAIGMNFALPMELSFGKLFSFQSELHFIQKGISTNLNNAVLPINKKSRSLTNILELPVLAKLKLGNEAFKFYVVAGPSVGVSLSKYNINIEDGDRNRSKEKFDTQGLVQDNRLEIGGVFGIGTEIGIKGSLNKLILDARYNLDFNNNEKIGDGANLNRDKIFYSGFGLTLGYMTKF